MQFTWAERKGHREKADALAVEINFIGRCIKYVDTLSDNTKTLQSTNVRGSKEVLQNANSELDEGRSNANGKGDTLSREIREKLLDQYDGHKSYHCMGKKKCSMKQLFLI